MQERDVLSVQYFEDHKRFADLINGFICGGRNVVDASQIRECDRLITKVQKNTGKPKAGILIRDVVREVHTDTRVMVITLENQTDIHYAMPVRVLDGDSAAYSRQLRKRRKEHREKRDLKNAEYVSGFGKGEKLVPVVTVVVYFGTDPWDGPRSLKEMLDLSEIPEEMAAMVNDYPIHLLEARRYGCLDNFQTDLRYVFGFLQNEQDGKKLKNYIEENSSALEHMEEDAYDLISVMSRSKELAVMKKSNRNKGGDYNMCKGLREWMADERRQGKELGREEGRKEGEEYGIRLAKQVIRMDLSGLSRDEIAAGCRITREYVDMILG